MDKKATTLIERFGFKDKDLTTPEHDRMLLWILNKNNVLSMLEALGLIKQEGRTTLHHRSFGYYESNKKCDWTWGTGCTGFCSKIEYKEGHPCCPKCNIRELKPDTLECSYCKAKIPEGEFERQILILQEEKKRKIKENEETMKSFAEQTIKEYNQTSAEVKAIRLKNFANLIEINVEQAIMGGYNDNYNIGFIDAVITIYNLIGNNDTTEHCHFSYTPFAYGGEYYVEIKPKVNSIGELIRQINMYRSHVKGGCWIVVTQTPNLKEILGSQNIFVYEWKETP